MAIRHAFCGRLHLQHLFARSYIQILNRSGSNITESSLCHSRVHYGNSFNPSCQPLVRRCSGLSSRHTISRSAVGKNDVALNRSRQYPDEPRVGAKDLLR